MPRHCNRIAAKWQEKYPEFQDLGALSGDLSAAPIMLQKEPASQRRRAWRRRGQSQVASTARAGGARRRAVFRNSL